MPETKLDSGASNVRGEQLEFVIGHDPEGYVTVNFNMSVKSLGITPTSAISFAEAMIDHALAVIEGKRQRVVDGLPPEERPPDAEPIPYTPTGEVP